MSSLSMELIGVDRLTDKIRRMGELAEQRLVKALVQAMLPIRDEVLRSLTAMDKSGNFYFRGNQYKGYQVHQASAPGEAPASDTGQLRRGISLPLLDKENLSVSLVSKAPYSADLEFGTSKMAARPFMTPAFIHNREYSKTTILIALRGLGLA